VTPELDFDSAQGWGIGDNPFPQAPAELAWDEGVYPLGPTRPRR